MVTHTLHITLYPSCCARAYTAAVFPTPEGPVSSMVFPSPLSSHAALLSSSEDPGAKSESSESHQGLFSLSSETSGQKLVKQIYI